MKKGLNKKVLGLGALATVLYLANEGKKKTETANLQTLFNPAAQPEQADTDYLLNEIKNNDRLRAYIKSLGIKGEDGTPGINGTNGLDGQSLRNYDYGLFYNSALEKFSLDNFLTNAAATLDIDDKINGLPSLVLTSVGSPVALWGVQKELISKSYLTKISFWAKKVSGTSGDISVRLRTYDSAGVANDYARGDSASVYINNLNIGTSWTKFTYYVYYNGTNVYTDTKNLHANAIKAHAVIYVTSLNTVCKFSNIVAESVSLGEPVPSNLAFLPTGQMVYDTTTWEVGIYNGTAVVWFAV